MRIQDHQQTLRNTFNSRFPLVLEKNVSIRYKGKVCWECVYPKAHKGGYPVSSLVFKGKRKQVLIHRISYSVHNKERLVPTDIIMHMCDNPRCCRPSHLRKGTPADNKADSVKKGRHARGSTQGPSILTERQVRRIFLTNKRIKSSELASKYGVCAMTIHLVRVGKSWTHVTNKLKAN